MGPGEGDYPCAGCRQKKEAQKAALLPGAKVGKGPKKQGGLRQESAEGLSQIEAIMTFWEGNDYARQFVFGYRGN